MGVALHLKKLEFPSSILFCAEFGCNWPSGSGEEDENVKSLQTDRRRTPANQKSSLLSEVS